MSIDIDTQLSITAYTPIHEYLHITNITLGILLITYRHTATSDAMRNPTGINGTTPSRSDKATHAGTTHWRYPTTTRVCTGCRQGGNRCDKQPGRRREYP